MTELIAPTLLRLRKSYKTGITRTVEWRKDQLRRLQNGINEMKVEMTDAIFKDLGRDAFVTEFISIGPCLMDIQFNLDHLDKFVQDVEVEHPLMFAPGKSRIKYEPLGVALIYGSWNYPYVVTLKPLVQAIATGNCAVLKPSEMAPESSKVMKTLVHKYLERECFTVIEGGPDVAAAIGNHPWDLICFTGSSMKGKLVAEAAAKNLIPCILELGGKCPAVVDESANLDLAASKVAFARFNNSGQTCISTDYVIVHESIKKQFTDILIQKTKLFYGEETKGGFVFGSDEMGKVVTDWHCDRIKKLIDTSKGTIVLGGNVQRNIKFVEPTIIVDPDMKSDIMKEEIFGPVIPIISFSAFQEAIDIINDQDKALAVYYFGKVTGNPNKERLLNETSSGAFVVNDVVVHMLNHEFGFGGVGQSGYGRYGGYEGFKQWSNPKSVMIRPQLNCYPFTNLYPPYTPAKQSFIRKATTVKGTQYKLGMKILKILILIFFFILYWKWQTLVVPPMHGLCNNFFK